MAGYNVHGMFDGITPEIPEKPKDKEATAKDAAKRLEGLEKLLAKYAGLVTEADKEVLPDAEAALATSAMFMQAPPDAIRAGVAALRGSLAVVLTMERPADVGEQEWLLLREFVSSMSDDFEVALIVADAAERMRAHLTSKHDKYPLLEKLFRGLSKLDDGTSIAGFMVSPMGRSARARRGFEKLMGREPSDRVPAFGLDDEDDDEDGPRPRRKCRCGDPDCPDRDKNDDHHT